jgi:hypothetical protein
LKVAFDWLETFSVIAPTVNSLGYQAVLAEKANENDLFCQKLSQAIDLAKQKKEPFAYWTELSKKCK